MLIEDLITYVNSGLVSAELVPAYENLGEGNLRVATIKLLGWLKACARASSTTPLSLNQGSEWCRNLSWLIRENRELSELFSLTDHQVAFATEIDESKRQELLSVVAAGYQPKLRE